MADKKPNPSSLLARVTGWVENDPDLSIDEDGNLIVAGDPATTIEVTETTEGLVFTHLGTGGGMLPARGSRVRVHHGDNGTVALSVTVYEDGFSRQAFADAIGALVAAVHAAGGPATAQTSAPPATAKKAVPEPEPTREMPAAWVPTHAVPAGGTRAWAGPDPGPDPIATLEPRVRLAIAEQRGDWARVVGSNGWTGWVDARVLEPLTGETPPAAAATGGPAVPLKIRTLPAVGAVAILISAFLPWAGVAKPIDIPAQILWDPDRAFGGGASFDLIWLIIGLAVLAALIAVTRAQPPLAVLVGLAAIAVAGLFAFQIYQAISDGGGGFSEFKDVMKLTPLLTVAGGALLIAGASKK